MESNLKFLEIAEQFNVNRKTNINQNIDQKPHLHIGQLLLQISAAQEDIEELKSKFRLLEVKSDYDLSGTTCQLTQRLSQLRRNLALITQQSANIESKLSNPVIGNSLPLAADNQQHLLTATTTLSAVIQEADGLLGSAAWIGNQDWQSVLRDLETLGTKIDLSASIFRSAAFNVQQYRAQDSL